MSLLTNIKEMPVPVRFITAHGFVCLVLFFAWLSIYAQLGTGTGELSSDAWVVGPLGLASAIAGLLMPLAAALMLGRVGFGRYIYLSCSGLAFVVPFAVNGNFVRAGVAFTITMLLAVYLFFNRAVVAYFAPKL